MVRSDRRSEFIEKIKKGRKERKFLLGIDGQEDNDDVLDEWDERDIAIPETRFLSRRVTTFKVVDMPFPLQAKTYALARRAMMKYYDEHDIARFIKRNLMKSTVLGYWQVVVGTNFASALTAELGRYIYFWIGNMGFLAFKIGSYNIYKV
ncbi:uncharacterized protein [Rhodnius prolixus]|uniref:uncharacterized protein n=1 Tax=Rhodnius prolixus TaxID=13249 RepID=UPI003D18E803